VHRTFVHGIPAREMQALMQAQGLKTFTSAGGFSPTHLEKHARYI